MPIPQVAPPDLAARLDAGEDLVLLDVREPIEVEFCRLESAVHVPLAEVPGRLDEIPRERTVVIYCHHGIRSQHAAAWLAGQGYARVENLAGGIDAWSIEVDPSVPRYA